jgi:hypothetical protein
MTITVVWRLRGKTFNVDEFLRKNPEITPSVVWRKGQPSGSGRRRELDSGLNIPFCEHETLEEVLSVTRRWLAKWGRRLSLLRRRGTESELDFGIYVGGNEHFAVKVAFPPPDALRLARAGVSIAVSAYPAGED